ncbi:GntR family transcriptional regulator [Lysinibacter cavernae]|uniref:DNA-binding transcriptional regulator YhcF (GntR family) n=1 Tax=Lysinibacter cavernae TaxID=1640652 RepID=A0A7X5TTB7_9MICO|nr:GntR family transcriptional regulator [Lysinibacter cavernae]NIH54010.1 DNA-binding transcriptional regulator YhcF (GntR family) [Lysinibacter cavernae]
MLLRIDPSAPAPLFEQIAEGIRSHILSGTVKAGERLPSAKTLAASLDLNIHTVLHALHLLRDEGMIELHRGRGAIVTGRAHDLEALQALIPSLVAEAKKLELDPAILSTMISQEYQK